MELISTRTLKLVKEATKIVPPSELFSDITKFSKFIGHVHEYN